MFIKAASTISYQPTFSNPGFSSKLEQLNSSSQLLVPDYSEFIHAMDRRRMSQVQKMSITCALDCLRQANTEQPDAIIVGTSMGCSVNIKNFLDKIYESEGGPLSPTSFIVSTHNTVAGQIGLLLKNHGYNMTYTHNTLSFEQSLVDAMLCFNDGLSNVLVGGADEEEESIYNTRERLHNNRIQLTSGASFFLLSNVKTSHSVRIVDVGNFSLVENTSGIVESFLKSNHLSTGKIDLVLFAINDNTNALSGLFGSGKIFNYQQITGTYYTNAAFALHYAFDILSANPHPVFGDQIQTVLVYNNLIPENLGLILLTSKIE
jgi:3-oxoacyl-[acyl-carrier-protein] synthase II